MRILVLGTGLFAVPVFQWLMDSKHEVLGLVTRPTQAAKGREKESRAARAKLGVSRASDRPRLR